MNPRKATRAEMRELADYLADKVMGIEDMDVESDESIREFMRVAVFDDYITSGPGYQGKIMLVVWTSGPASVEAYIWPRPILPGEEDLWLGEINWDDGRHERRIALGS